MNGLQEISMTRDNRIVKIRSLVNATINDKHHLLTQSSRKNLTNTILRVGSNDVVKSTFRDIASGILNLKGFIDETLPQCKVSNFIEIALWHGCSPVNLRHIFRSSFPKNTSGWLLLFLVEYDAVKNRKIDSRDLVLKVCTRIRLI